MERMPESCHNCSLAEAMPEPVTSTSWLRLPPAQLVCIEGMLVLCILAEKTLEDGQDKRVVLAEGHLLG